jgi:hypothetical protein
MGRDGFDNQDKGRLRAAKLMSRATSLGRMAGHAKRCDRVALRTACSVW